MRIETELDLYLCGQSVETFAHVRNPTGQADRSSQRREQPTQSGGLDIFADAQLDPARNYNIDKARRRQRNGGSAIWQRLGYHRHRDVPGQITTLELSTNPVELVDADSIRCTGQLHR